MGKLHAEPRLFPVHHDLQDVIVNVLATDQVERFIPKAQTPRVASPIAHVANDGPRVSIEQSRPVAAPPPVARLQSAPPVQAIPAPSGIKQPAPQPAQPSKASRTEPMHATFEHVSVQVQRMYVHRQRIGFWCRAALSMVLLSVLGFVCYYLISNSPQLELSHFL